MLAATLPDMAETTGPEPAEWAVRMERLRADLGLTQSDLARSAGVPLPRLKSYIQGRARQPRGTEIADIAKALKVDPFWLQHGIEPPNAAPAPIQMPTRQEMPQDIPVMGNGAGAPDGAINMGDAVDYLRRPPGLRNARDVYAVYVTGDSMEPRFFAGDPVMVSPSRPARIGDDVVVQCAIDGGGQDKHLVAFVKTLTGRQGSRYSFRQYNPAGDWHPPGPVHSVHRIYTLTDLFAAG